MEWGGDDQLVISIIVDIPCGHRHTKPTATPGCWEQSCRRNGGALEKNGHSHERRASEYHVYLAIVVRGLRVVGNGEGKVIDLSGIKVSGDNRCPCPRVAWNSLDDRNGAGVAR